MVIVVGAGPAGLATAYYLQKRKRPYLILEKQAVGFAWQNHYDSLHLHTLKEVSGLPGLPMPAHYPTFPSAAQVHAYLDGYAGYFDLNIECGVEVLNATYRTDGWHLQTNQASYQCDTLIVATGIWSRPYCPTFKGEEHFGGPIIHARHYQNAHPFLDQRVLVVGAGNSGAEIAVELSENRVDTGIAIRTGTTFTRYPTSPTTMRLAAWFFRTFPRPLTEPLMTAVRRDFNQIGIAFPPGSILDAYPVVGYELPEAVAHGNITVYPGIQQLQPSCVQFKNGQSVPFDAIILATGYRPAIQFVADELELDEQGYPIPLTGRFPRNPNLFCVGFTYPATEGWLQSIGRFARSVVDEVYKA